MHGKMALKVCAHIVAVAFLLGNVQQATADLLTVQNHSFEADFAADGTFPTFTPTGWQTYDPFGLLPLSGNAVGVLNPNGTTFFPGGAPDGDNVALIFLEDSYDQGPVGLTQVLTDTLQANTHYSLEVEVGNIASGTGLPPFDTFGFYDLDGFPGYQVQLLAGGVVLAEDNNSLFGSIAEGTFESTTVEFTTGSTHAQLGQALEIRLINRNETDTAEDPGIEVDFDNVRLNATAVPEPGTFASVVVLVLGLTYCSIRARRKC